MNSIFSYTSKRAGQWRGWLKNDQTIELHWGNRTSAFGIRVVIHANEDNGGHRLLHLAAWRFSAWLPLGIVEHPWDVLDGPQWGFMLGNDPDIAFYWGHRYWFFPWPWSHHTLAYQQQLIAGDEDSWVSVFRDDVSPYSEEQPYVYTLSSGEVQHRTAKITKRRHIITWSASRWIGWPRWIRESIDVTFSDEVGEHTGSWKGGCLVCGYELRPGETMEQSLRRMERERRF
jgi:hypothetical protein